MHCQDVEGLLAEWVRGELSPGVEALLQTHISACRVCKSALAKETKLKESLCALSAWEMPEALPAVLLKQARDADVAAQHQHVLAKSKRLLSMAASILVVCGIGFMLGRGSVEQSATDPSVLVQLPLGTTQMVALKIDAPQAFANVEFVVSLPENVVLEDQPHLREFAWNGELQAGVNVLSLPLVGVKSEGGQLVAKVKYGGTERSLRIPLAVAS